MVGCFDADEHSKTETQLGRISQSDPPGQDAGCLKLLDALPTGRLRQAHFLSNLSHREGRVAHQFGNDFAVYQVQLSHDAAAFQTLLKGLRFSMHQIKVKSIVFIVYKVTDESGEASPCFLDVLWQRDRAFSHHL